VITILSENTNHSELPLMVFIGKNVADIEENLSDYLQRRDRAEEKTNYWANLLLG